MKSRKERAMDLEKVIARIGELVGDVVAQFKAVKVQRKGFIKQLWTWAVATYELVKGVVLAVEQAAQEFGGLTGAQKKEVIVTYLNRAIDIPVLPEFVEKWVFSYLVDKAVQFWNTYTRSHSWPLEVLGTAQDVIGFAKDVLAEPEPADA